MTKITEENYVLKYNWGDTHLSYSDCGLVFGRGKPRETAFFEAYPLNTFLRGEGATILEAEEEAWKQYQKFDNCDEHVYERTSEDGSGKCIKCGIRHSNVLNNERKCYCCGKEANFDITQNGEPSIIYVCAKHYHEKLLVAKEAFLKIEASNDSLYYNRKASMSYQLSDLYKHEVLIETGLIDLNKETNFEIAKANDLIDNMRTFVFNAIVDAVQSNGMKLSIVDHALCKQNLSFNGEEELKELIRYYISQCKDPFNVKNEEFREIEVPEAILNSIFSVLEDDLKKRQENRKSCF